MATSPNTKPATARPKFSSGKPLIQTIILCPVCAEPIDAAKAIPEALYVCAQCGEVLIFNEGHAGLLAAILTPDQSRFHATYHREMWQLVQFMSGEIKHFHRWQPPPGRVQ